MAAALVPRELGTWSLGALALGALEGGLLGVIVKNQFSGVTEPALLNFCVALVAGAPAFTNLSSFFFAAHAMGKDKLVVLSRLLLVISACLLIMALPGKSPLGLAVFCVMTILARAAWSGVLTVRAAVWRANYQRHWRARVTARMAQLSSLIIAGFGAVVGLALDWQPWSYRLIFPLAAIAMFAAAIVYRGARIRRHGHLIRSELAEAQLGEESTAPARMWSLLREDRDFRRYMAGMLMFGGGNLMVIPMMVILLNEQFTVSRLAQVMITTTVPLVCLCFAIRYWARMLDSRHIFDYRAVHSWFYVGAILVFMLAGVLQTSWLLWPGSLLLGVARAGGDLGWNLGHNDFSTDAKASLYMSVHVTLTGLRGLIAPLIGVAFYQYLDDIDPQLAPWALALPMVLATAGSLWFVYLNHERNRRSEETG